MSKKAIFLDRDDTLIIDSGYMYDPSQLQFFNDTLEALKLMQQKGYALFIVTNQSGIGRGYFSEKHMHEFHEHLLNKLQEAGIKVQEIAFCPHAPLENCDCRKPEAKLVEDLIEKYHFDKKQCYMIGDKLSDALTGKNAGIHSWLVRNTHPDFPSFETLLDIAHFLK